MGFSILYARKTEIKIPRKFSHRLESNCDLEIEFDMFYLKTLSLYFNRYVTKSISRPSSDKRIFTSLIHAHSTYTAAVLQTKVSI